MEKINGIDNYQYGFSDQDVSVFKTKKGLNEEIIKENFKTFIFHLE